MTRILRSGFTIRLLAGLALIAALVVAATQSAPAAKPSGGSSTPTGTIYFTGGSYYTPGKFIWGVKPSGIPNGTTAAVDLVPGFYDQLPAQGSLALPIPSRLPQGSNTFHDRWWIAALQSDFYDEALNSSGSIVTNVPHYDLYALRSDPNDRTQLIKVQLTDLYGVVNCAGAASWSNDTNEAETSFVLVRGFDIRNSFVEDADGTYYDQSQQIPVTLRIPLKASEIPLPTQGTFDPVGPNDDLDSLLGPDMSYRFIPGLRDISDPEGGLYYVKSDPNSPPSDNPSAPNRLVIADAAVPYANNPVQILWDGNAGAPRQSIDAVWSPDGTSIAFIDTAASTLAGGDIWVCAVSGATPPKRIVPVSKTTGKNSSTFTYAYPVWSPDSKHLAYQKKEWDTASGSLKSYTISRVSVSDGKTLDLAYVFLYSGFDGLTLRWSADN